MRCLRGPGGYLRLRNFPSAGARVREVKGWREDGGYDGVIMIIIKSAETVRTTDGPKYHNNPAQANTPPNTAGVDTGMVATLSPETAVGN